MFTVKQTLLLGSTKGCLQTPFGQIEPKKGQSKGVVITLVKRFRMCVHF